MDLLKKWKNDIKENCNKFTNGNNSAGTRARKNFLDIMGLAQDGRNIVTKMRAASEKKE